MTLRALFILIFGSCAFLHANDFEQLKVKEVYVSDELSCALFENGKAKCWGCNYWGELGQGHNNLIGDNPNEMGKNLKFIDLGKEEKIKQMSVGSYNCALLESGNVKCWGYNRQGQLGQEHLKNIGDHPWEMGDHLKPINLGSGKKAIQIARSCALLQGGEVKCWGANYRGELGGTNVESIGGKKGDMGDNLKSIDFGLGNKAVQLFSSGSTGTRRCVILENGQIKCWGSNEGGALGLGHNRDIGLNANEMGDSLKALDLAGEKVEQLAMGASHSCVLLNGNRVKCWGFNSEAQLGTGDRRSIGDEPDEMGEHLTTIDFGSSKKVVKLVAGGNQTCVLLEGGELKCWGRNYEGQLGQEHNANIGDDPNEMGQNLLSTQLGLAVSKVSISIHHSCALLVNGGIKCWGRNNRGNLGLGNTKGYGYGPNQMGNNLPFVNF